MARGNLEDVGPFGLESLADAHHVSLVPNVAKTCQELQQCVPLGLELESAGY